MNEVEKMLKSTLQGNSCENCGCVFSDSDTIFNSNNKPLNGLTKTNVFCSIYCVNQYKE